MSVMMLIIRENCGNVHVAHRDAPNRCGTLASVSRISCRVSFSCPSAPPKARRPTVDAKPRPRTHIHDPRN